MRVYDCVNPPKLLGTRGSFDGFITPDAPVQPPTHKVQTGQ